MCGDLETPRLQGGEEIRFHFYRRGVLEAVRLQGSAAAKRLLSFHLNLIRPGKNRSSDAWYYLDYALSNPNEAPDWPSSFEEHHQWQFVRTLTYLSQQVPKKRFKIESTNRADSYQIQKFAQRWFVKPPATRRVQPIDTPIQLAIPSKIEIDGNFTVSCFEAHFSPLDQDIERDFSSVFVYTAEWLTKDEKIYEKAFEQELIDFRKDYLIGRQSNQQRLPYLLENHQELREKLTEKISTLDTEMSDLEVAILELANFKKDDPFPIRLAENEAKAPEITLEQLIRIFFIGDTKRFQIALPHLVENQNLVKKIADAYQLEHRPELGIEYLYQLIGFYLNLAVYRARLLRAENCCRDLNSAQPNSPKWESIVTKLADELNPLTQPHYPVEKFSKFLAYEYLTQFTLWQDQVALMIKCRETKNLIAQLPMGRGKTTTIAPYLILEMENPNRLILVVVLSSQYISVCNDMRHNLKKWGGRELEEFSISRRDLTLSTTLEIENCFKQMMLKGSPGIFKVETLKLFLLESVYRVSQASELEEISHERLAGINSLRRIVSTFRNQARAIFDEVHRLFDPQHQMNFPIGEKKFLPEIRVKLVEEIFVPMFLEEAPISATEKINLKQLMGLEKNWQTLVTLKELKGEVAKAVAWHLVHHFEPLELLKPYLTSFYRYISGQITAEINEFFCNGVTLEDTYGLNQQDEADLEFLIFLKGVKENGWESERLIALTKHMFEAVFPIAFQYKGNQNYGRGGKIAGEVRRYDGVSNPTENEFAHPWAAVTYHYLTAAQFGIGKKQFAIVMKLYRRDALSSSHRLGIAVEETPELKEFKKYTGGLDPFTVDLAKQWNTLKTFLSQNPLARLKFETKFIVDHLSYYSKRLVATGSSLSTMVDNCLGISATAWNFVCYDPSVSHYYEPSPGTEGSIVSTVLSRTEKNLKIQKKDVHLIDGETLEDFIQEVIAIHPQKELVDIVLDPLGQFRCYSNLAVAQALCRARKKPFLFFTYDTQTNLQTNQRTPNTLAFIKNPHDEPIMIGSSLWEHLEAKGLKVGEFGAYLDEPHTIGTNLPFFAPNAIAVMIIGEKMFRHDYTQAFKRVRDASNQQRVEHVIPSPTLKNLLSLNQMNLPPDLKLILQQILTMIKPQAIAKANRYLFSRYDIIDNIFSREMLDHHLLPNELDLAAIKKGFLPFKEIIEVEQEEMPTGDLRFNTPSIQLLEEYKQRKLGSLNFPETTPQEKEIKERITRKIDAVILEASLSPYLPQKWPAHHSKSIDTDIFMIEDVDMQTNIHISLDIDRQLLENLIKYERDEGDLRPEDIWKSGLIENLLAAITQGATHFQNEPHEGNKHQLFPLPTIFSPSHYSYHQSFSQLFDDRVLVTTSWVYTTQKRLSVFHKTQRPAESLLILPIANGGYRGILLSQKECQQFKEFLDARYHSNEQLKTQAWLTDPLGTLYTASPPLPDDEEIGELFFQCHLFNGAIEHLIANPEKTNKWLGDKSKRKNGLEFLQLRVARDEKNKNLFLQSKLFLQ